MKYLLIILLVGTMYGQETKYFTWQKITFIPLSMLSVYVHAYENHLTGRLGESREINKRWHQVQDMDRYLTIGVGINIGADAFSAKKKWYKSVARILSDGFLYNAMHGFFHKPFLNWFNKKPFFEETFTSSYYDYGSKFLNDPWVRGGILISAIIINYLVFMWE